jgi:hypothetical protein
LTVDDGLGGNNTACFSLPTLGQNDAPIDCINTSMAPNSTTTYELRAQIANCIGAGIHIDNTATIDTVSTDPNPLNDSLTVGFDHEDGSCNDIVCDDQDSSPASRTLARQRSLRAGQCVPGRVVCDDNSVCTDDSCDPFDQDGDPCVFDSSQSGDRVRRLQSVHDQSLRPDHVLHLRPSAPAGTPCDDQQSCTNVDACDGQGSCVGVVTACDDGNDCTEDPADELNSCACLPHTNRDPGTPCDDNDGCTGADTSDSCDGNGHCGGAPVSCDDHNACTDDVCVFALGCVNSNNTNPCDDGDACTTGDACGGGSCGGSPVICTASDQCHVAGTCSAGVCSNPAAPDGTTCDDGNAGTDNDVCTGGSCAGTANCAVEPKPKPYGYYKKLCKDGHSHPNTHEDALTNADAACVGGLTDTFAGITTVEEICAVLENNGGSGDGYDSKECNKAEKELMALALNVCTGRICLGQEIDSSCSGSGSTQTTVQESLDTADDILSDPGRDKNVCKDAKCLAKEINNGHGITTPRCFSARPRAARFA